jgi:hypothetical protein
MAYAVMDMCNSNSFMKHDVSVSATAFVLIPVVPLFCQPTQIRRPQIDGSTIRASSPAPRTSLPTIVPVLDSLEWWWPIACEPVSGVPRRSGFSTNDLALNLVVRTVGMRPCKLFSEMLKGLKVSETAQSSWNGTVELVISKI